MILTACERINTLCITTIFPCMRNCELHFCKPTCHWNNSQVCTWTNMNKYGHTKYLWAGTFHLFLQVHTLSFSSQGKIRKKNQNPAATVFNQCAAICVQQAAENHRILHVLCSCTEAWLSHLHHPYIFQPTAMSKTENQPELWLKPQEQRSAKGYRNQLLVVQGYNYK